MHMQTDTFRRLCLARDILAELREDQPTIQTIAAEIEMSPFHFIRQVESLFGLTPYQFRIEHRLYLAKRLLASGHHSITDVCLEVGMSSLGSF